MCGDGSFCNRTCLRAREQRTELIVRTRKDAVLCGFAPCLRCRARCRLCPAAQVASTCPSAVVPRSGHFAPQGDDRACRNVNRLRHRPHRPCSDKRRRCVTAKCRNSRGGCIIIMIQLSRAIYEADDSTGTSPEGSDRGGQARAGQARRAAPRESLPPAHRLRVSRLPPQGHSPAEARPVLPPELHPKGKGGTRLIKRADVPAIRIDLANYTRLRNLVDRWIDFAIQLSDLKLELRAAGDKPTKRA